EPVGDPAARRDEYREAEEVGCDRDVEMERIGAQVAGDLRQRGGDDGPVEVFHEERARHDEGHDHVTGEGASHAGQKLDGAREGAKRGEVAPAMRPRGPGPEGEVVETEVPARLDRLPWSRFHWLVVVAL